MKPHQAASRRSFLRGGVVAAGGVAAAPALPASPAGAAPNPPVYLPSGPFRMYDSRLSGGKLYPLEERDVHTGAGPEIRALTFNLTVTETEGPGGWLALFPGDVDWPGTSSVNWFGPDQNIANNAFVRIPANGVVTVRCGGQGGTHFVLDVIGESVTSAIISDVNVKENIRAVRW